MKPNPRLHGAGRKKGTLNRKTKELQDKCDELGVDPFEVLLLMTKGDWKALGYESKTRLVSASEHGDIYEDTIPPKLRADCAKEVCNYLLPKRKAVEHTGKLDLGLQAIVEDLATKTEEELKQLVKNG